MFKKKVTYGDVCRQVVLQGSEMSTRGLATLRDQLTELDDRFKIPDPDKAELDVMLAVISLELRVAKNLLKQTQAEKVSRGVYDLLGDDDSGQYSKHELDLYEDRYAKALEQGANPLSGVGSHLIFRLSGDNTKTFTDDGGRFNMIADMVVMDVLTKTTAVIKMVATDYKIS